MKTKTTEIYFCDHCNKVYQRKHNCVKHEDLCKKNPENIPLCYSCEFCEKKETNLNVEVERLGANLGVYYDEEIKTFSLLFCKAKNVYLVPIVSNKKGSNFCPNVLDEIEQILTPMECDKYKSTNTW